jgi:hypothetical protein
MLASSMLQQLHLALHPLLREAFQKVPLLLVLCAAVALTTLLLTVLAVVMVSMAAAAVVVLVTVGTVVDECHRMQERGQSLGLIRGYRYVQLLEVICSTVTEVVSFTKH